MTAKRALITGVTGQDGAYLAQFLLGKGYEVHGLLRRSASAEVVDERRRWLGIAGDVRLHDGNLIDLSSLFPNLPGGGARRGLQPRRRNGRRRPRAVAAGESAMRAEGGRTRVLVTGAGGFVGPHLVDALRRIGGGDVELIATSKDAETHRLLGPLAAFDVCDAAAVGKGIARWRPTHIVNLAGLAAPASAAADPEAAWAVHLHGARNLARAILAHAPACWLFQVGSGLVYGASARSGEPVDERTILAPLDEYSASKAAADLALGALVPAGLKCVRFRPFNHTGRGQSEDFVVPAFAMQVARIEAGLAPPILRVGNLDAERDILDVADVVDAYALALYAADDLEPGDILNIAAGRTRRIGDMLTELLKFSQREIAVECDPSRHRRSDMPVLVGDSSRLRAKLGWVPRRALHETLLDVLEDCRARLRAVGAP